MEERPIYSYLWSFEESPGVMAFWEVRIAAVTDGLYHGSAVEEAAGRRVPWFILNLDNHADVIESIKRAIRSKYYEGREVG